MADRGTQVFLYYNERGQLVGYGSIGTTEWSWPPPDGDKQLVSIIPSVAIATGFQGEPKDGPKEEMYCRQIMDHLVKHALENGTEYLALMVHEENDKAIKLYTKYGFEFFEHRHGKKYRKMFCVLRP
jgi:ribosomal protein S18 acetylase RimI-like enzyme